MCGAVYFFIIYLHMAKCAFSFILKISEATLNNKRLQTARPNKQQPNTLLVYVQSIVEWPGLLQSHSYPPPAQARGREQNYNGRLCSLGHDLKAWGGIEVRWLQETMKLHVPANLVGFQRKQEIIGCLWWYFKRPYDIFHLFHFPAFRLTSENFIFMPTPFCAG